MRLRSGAFLSLLLVVGFGGDASFHLGGGPTQNQSIMTWAVGVCVGGGGDFQAEVATTAYFFCLAHLAEFRQVYDYAWDRGTSEMGYYRGSRFFPMQMATEQYLSIMVTIMAVP